MSEPLLKAPKLDVEDSELDKAKVVIGRLILWLRSNTEPDDDDILSIMVAEKADA